MATKSAKGAKKAQPAPKSQLGQSLNKAKLDLDGVDLTRARSAPGLRTIRDAVTEAFVRASLPRRLALAPEDTKAVTSWLLRELGGKLLPEKVISAATFTAIAYLTGGGARSRKSNLPVAVTPTAIEVAARRANERLGRLRAARGKRSAKKGG